MGVARSFSIQNGLPLRLGLLLPAAVTRSRCLPASTRRMQKPLSKVWKVTRSTRPKRTSVGALSREPPRVEVRFTGVSDLGAGVSDAVTCRRLQVSRRMSVLRSRGSIAWLPYEQEEVGHCHSTALHQAK